MDLITTILFNTSIKHQRFLPSSPFDAPKESYHSIDSGGFGLDFGVNDLKVFSNSEIIIEDRYGYRERGRKKVEVYEVGIGIWRDLDYVDLNLPTLLWLTSSIFYKGSYLWIATSEELEEVILCFDLSTEIFHNMKIADTEFSNGILHSLLLFFESLSLNMLPLFRSNY